METKIMGTIIGTIVAAIATAAAGLVCIKISKNQQRREAEKDVEENAAKIKAEKESIRDAVFERDDAKVNEFVAKFLIGTVLAAGVVGCIGGKAEVKYVAADRRIVSMTNEWGVACKAVPDVVFAEMCEKLIELDALKKEKEVDKRVGQ